MKTIKIGKVEIPLDDYAIGGTAILGIRDSGKTYAAKGIAEQLLDYGVPIIVFDAIGPWRHLKTPAGKHGKGFKVVVAGGKSPDVPLTPQSAPELVRAAIKCNIPLIIDLYDKQLSKADWRKIVQACFRVLLYENEGVRHVFLEETAEYAPQKVMDGQTYAEVEKLVRMGGNVSLGITLINQRSQEVNKAVLDLCENLVLMRQRGAHAIDALSKWVDRLSPDFAQEIAAKMPNMSAGECWVFTGQVENPTHTRTAHIRSYHPDRRKPESGKLRPSSDVGDFIASMQATLPKLEEERQAKDPEALRRRIAELERNLRQLTDSAAVPVVDPAILDHEFARGKAEGLREGFVDAKKQAEEIFANVQADVLGKLKLASEGFNLREMILSDRVPAVSLPLEQTNVIVGSAPKPGNRSTSFPAVTRSMIVGKAMDAHAHPIGKSTRNKDVNRNAVETIEMPRISPSTRKILDAIHGAYPLRLSFAAATTRAGISPRSSAYDKYRAEVAASREVLADVDGKYQSLPLYANSEPMSMADRLHTWIRRLRPTYGRMLKAIVERGPIDKFQVADEAGVSHTSSGLDSGLKELEKLALIVHNKRNHTYEAAEGLR